MPESAKAKKPPVDPGLDPQPMDDLKDAHRFAHRAMTAPFEILVAEGDKKYAGQAAQAAFDEIDRVERLLSRFVENSDISRINKLASHDPVQVEPETMQCLLAAKRMYDVTGGVFDVTVGALFACWRGADRQPRTPSDEELAEARAKTGMNYVGLDEERLRVRLLREGVQVDLGGIGKGFAVDHVAAILKDWEVGPSLVHASSTALALGPPPDRPGWPLGVGGEVKPDGKRMARRIVHLTQRALSASGTATRGRHIIDPRSGRPASGPIRAWALAPTAAEADALSTAFMVLAPKETEALIKRHPKVTAFLRVKDQDALETFDHPSSNE